MRSWALVASLLALALGRPAAAESSPSAVVVVPVNEAAASGATELLLETLRGLEGLRVVSLADPDAVLGPGSAARLAACADDACRVSALGSLAGPALLVGEIAGGRSVRLRLVDTASTAGARAIARVSTAITAGDGGLRRAVIEAVEELFPTLSAQRMGSLSVRADVDGAAVFLDRRPIGLAPVEGLRVGAGPHSVRVEAAGHAPFEATVEVQLGADTEVAASLSKNRSLWPLYLGAGAVGAGAVGLILGLSAQDTADAWATGCAAASCASGFTRARYDADQDAVAVKRTTANALFAVAGGLAVGAIVYWFADPGEEVAP